MDKTRPQKLDERQVREFLADAERRSVAARKNLKIDSEAAYQISYEAIIKGSLALMLSHGERPRKQMGHHIAILESARKRLGGSTLEMFVRFDRMRRKRNDAFYDVAIISQTDAEEAVSAAELYLAQVKAAIERVLEK
jgi:uncharacterized protein (UPF0332 family)